MRGLGAEMHRVWDTDILIIFVAGEGPQGPDNWQVKFGSGTRFESRLMATLVRTSDVQLRIVRET